MIGAFIVTLTRYGAYKLSYYCYSNQISGFYYRVIKN